MGMFVHHTGMGYNLNVLDLARGKKRHNSSDPQLVFILVYQAGLIPPEIEEVASFSYSVVQSVTVIASLAICLFFMDGPRGCTNNYTAVIGFLIQLSPNEHSNVPGMFTAIWVSEYHKVQLFVYEKPIASSLVHSKNS